MKRCWVAVLGFGLLFAQAGAEERQVLAGEAPGAKEESQVLKTDGEKSSYVLGVDTAKNLRQLFGIEVDQAALIQGIKDGLAGQKFLMTTQELTATRAAIQRAMRKRAAERQLKTRKTPAEDSSK